MVCHVGRWWHTSPTTTPSQACTLPFQSIIIYHSVEGVLEFKAPEINVQLIAAPLGFLLSMSDLVASGAIL